MRMFYLLNADGEKYDLTVEYTSFFYSAEGLGYKDDVEYQRIGNTFAILSDQMKQGVISGMVKFWNPGAHAQYQKFTAFCQNKPLILVYKPDDVEYMRKGTVTAVEYKEEECLVAEVEFSALTPFYRMVNVVNHFDEDDKNGKIYNYTYPYRYMSTGGNSVALDSDSYLESPCRLTMYGPLVNPSWTHYVNNAEHCTGKINATIPAGYKLVVDTTSIPYSIKEYNLNGDLVTDLYQASDFSTQRFILLQCGSNRITIKDDDGNEAVVQAEGAMYYAGV